MNLFLSLALLLAILGMNGCSESGTKGKAQSRSSQQGTFTPSSEQSNPTADTPRVVLFPPGREPVPITVELARTPHQRQRGLMFRKYLAKDAGMLFLFENPQHLSFWMRNTYIPLDMIFIESNLRILGIVENTTPLSEESCSVPGQSQYVLETNAGVSRRHGLGKGTKVSFENIPGFKPADPS